MSSRRTFVKQLGAAAMTAAVPGLLSARTRQGKDKLAVSNIKLDSSWDVIIVGGGPSGCTAAISAARQGAKTLLIEAMGQLGGMGTAGMVPAWCPFSDGEKIIYRGLAETIFNESKKGVPHERPSKLDWVNINPEYLMKIYEKMVRDSGAKVLFFSRVAAVEKSADDTVDAIIVANKNGLTAFKAKVFIDATGDGDLATWAGAEYMKTDVLQDATLCFSIANVDTYAYLNGPNLHSDDKRSPIFDAIRSGRYPRVSGHMCLNLVGPGVVQFNAGHLHADSTDPWSVTDAMIEGRLTAEEYLLALKDVAPKAFANAFVVKTASLLGARDSRRIVGDYVFTGDDWRQRKTFDDEIGRNCYYIDVHKKDFVPVHYKKGDSHGIPYRCLTPRDLKNVLTAGRCISTDEEAFGSLRVMPPCLVTGEAAGTAAALAASSSSHNVHSVDVTDLRTILRSNGAYFL